METKTLNLQLKARGEAGNGSFSGLGNATGILDRGYDLVPKGAFDDLDGLETSGFIANGHDWRGLPIAMVDKAYEDDEGLKIDVEYHSTQAAQEARTVVNERLAKGKEVGLSIGYEVKRSRPFESVDALDEYCKEQGIKFDRASAGTYNGYCRLLEKISVFEVSIVTVPMNQLSRVTSGKSAFRGSRTLPDHTDDLLAEAVDFTNRIKGLSDTREGKLGERPQSEMRRAIEGMRKNADELEALLPPVETTSEAAKDDATTNPDPAQGVVTDPTPEQKALIATFSTP